MIVDNIILLNNLYNLEKLYKIGLRSSLLNDVKLCQYLIFS